MVDFSQNSITLHLMHSPYNLGSKHFVKLMSPYETIQCNISQLGHPCIKSNNFTKLGHPTKYYKFKHPTKNLNNLQKWNHPRYDKTNHTEQFIPLNSLYSSQDCKWACIMDTTTITAPIHPLIKKYPEILKTLQIIPN